MPVYEVPYHGGGFSPCYVPCEDMYLWLSACGAVVLLRSVRGGSLGLGKSASAVTEEITARTFSPRRPSASCVCLSSPCFVEGHIFKKGKHWFKRIKVSEWFRFCECVLVFTCVCGCEGSLFLALHVFVCALCVFRRGMVLALQGMPLKMGRATFNPHTASSESRITRCHVKSLSRCNPNSVKHSRD